MSEPSARPAYTTALLGPRELHGEVLDPGTNDVWQSLEPITREDVAALPLEPGWSRLGVGRAAMDEHWFTRSPGRAEDGPMALREIGGLGFGLCARPASAPSRPAGPAGPVKMLVDKHHVLRFEAGREIPILIDSAGDRFVHVIEGGAEMAPLALPEGWARASIALEYEWVLPLPNPTTVFFFPNGDSFQGPIEVASRAGATSPISGT